MYLKKPLWSEKIQMGKGDSTESNGETLASTAVGELVNSLNQQRVYREVTLALRTGLRDARAEFSFLRVRGLRSILKFLRNVAESDATIDLFNQSQSIPELQGISGVVLVGRLHYSLFFSGFDFQLVLFTVVPVLFQHSLKETGDDYNDNRMGNLDHIFGVEPMKITSPSTDAEVALALRVLEGCCLLHPQSTSFAHQYKAIQVPMHFYIYYIFTSLLGKKRFGTGSIFQFPLPLFIHDKEGANMVVIS